MSNAALTPDRVPLPAWANVLSLDAVFVAATWQQLLMRVFCNRSARWPESIALSLTVWLIYVADRLLDAAKLDVDRPHTLRHRFYRRHGWIFVWLWILALLLNTLIVVRYLPTELLHNGLLLASAVLVYGASVHFSSKRSRDASATRVSASGKSKHSKTCIPKEVRVGVLFAMGVSLATWTQLSSDLQYPLDTTGIIDRTIWPLLATTCVLAILFSWNCILVARFEREYDRAQAFPSIATRPGWGNFDSGHRYGQAGMAIFLVALAPLIFLFARLPLPIEIAVFASTLGLMVSLVLPGNCLPRPSNASLPHVAPTMFDVRGAWVDAVLWTPPLLLLLCWV